MPFTNDGLYFYLNKFFLEEMFKMLDVSFGKSYLGGHNIFIDLIVDFCTFFNIFL